MKVLAPKCRRTQSTAALPRGGADHRAARSSQCRCPSRAGLTSDLELYFTMKLRRGERWPPCSRRAATSCARSTGWPLHRDPDQGVRRGRLRAQSRRSSIAISSRAHHGRRFRQVYVMDWASPAARGASGLGVQRDAVRQPLDRAGDWLGTSSYMSPEQARGEHDARRALRHLQPRGHALPGAHRSAALRSGRILRAHEGRPQRRHSPARGVSHGGAAAARAVAHRHEANGDRPRRPLSHDDRAQEGAGGPAAEVVRTCRSALRRRRADHGAGRARRRGIHHCPSTCHAYKMVDARSWSCAAWVRRGLRRSGGCCPAGHAAPASGARKAG